MCSDFKKKSVAAPAKKPYYDLAEVHRLIAEEKYIIRGNALDCAYRDFGWNSDDILSALMDLKLKHFYKTDVLKNARTVALDFYRAPKLKNERVYTHLYIDDDTGTLIINSFKADQGSP